MTHIQPFPSAEFGRGLLGSFAAPGGGLLVVSQPEPWQMVRQAFSGCPVHLVDNMEHAEVKRALERLCAAKAVAGIGGGSACDFAKYVAWRRSIPLLLAPSALSVDAAFTRAVAVREGSRVRYLGAAVPKRLVVDFDLVEKAPRVLNRSGAGDILSIATALWDWQEAGRRGLERFDPAIAAEARGLLDRLYAGVEALRDLTEPGLRMLAELFAAEVALCERAGNSRPEEGSEHHLAYAIEACTRRHFLHGQLVCLCVLVAARLQGQALQPIRHFLEALQLPCGLADVGITRDELRAALRSMPGYLREEKELLPGVFHFAGELSPETSDDLLSQLP